jgi:CHAT domain-containing protein
MHASDYNILHLAMHTRMNDDDPMMSNLVFSQSNDTLNDGRLYAYEIYNLQLNAQMAVLSSCASGFGNMLKGEGMMSLARGFIYAGCPSIIMTLWQVSDNSSADLMTSFYKYLKKGKSKQEALRLAKIKYLNRSDDLKANPYFWSGFVCIGDGSPIYRKSAYYYWGLVIFGFILIVSGAQYYSYRKSGQGRRKRN